MSNPTEVSANTSSNLLIGEKEKEEMNSWIVHSKPNRHRFLYDSQQFTLQEAQTLDLHLRLGAHASLLIDNIVKQQQQEEDLNKQSL